MKSYLFFGLLFFIACKTDNSEYYSKEDVTFNETYRPQYHFTPDSMWMNDPNGLVFFDDEYHLFYQYHPKSTVWGPMHWGHAVSENLVDWYDKDIALYPDSLGYIFSGSCVVDWQNTSGFGVNGKPPMIAIFTHHDMAKEKVQAIDFQYQSIAYSLDRGKSWTKYKGNPVVKNPGIKDFRDPKVFWYEEGKKWVMVFAAKDKVLFYDSPDLINWKATGSFGIKNDTRLWECPDLFRIKVEGKDMYKWVLITSMQSGAPNGGTGTSYWVGDFDGNTFKSTNPINDQQWLDYGKDNYALVTFSDITINDGRRIGIGWMSNWQYAQEVPSKRWRSALTLPRSLNLHQINETFFSLSNYPVSEIGKLSSNDTIKVIPTLDTFTVSKMNMASVIKFIMADNDVDWKLNLTNSLTDTLSVGYDHKTKSIYIDRSKAGQTAFNENFGGRHSAPFESPIQNCSIFLDQSSIELFINDGKLAMTEIFFVDRAFDKLTITQGAKSIKEMNISSLRKRK